MDKQEFEQRMQERWRGRRGRFGERGRIWVGIALLIVGGLFLAKASGVLFPAWFFTWPVLLIGIGLFSGIKHRFRGIGWLFPLAIGGIFLADRLSTDINLRPYFWPIVLIAAGLFVIFRPKGRHCRRGGGRDDNALQIETQSGDETFNQQRVLTDGTDAIEATAVFGGVKRNMLSKNFQGGEITTFMGGAEINLMQADFNGRAVIECTNIFGGTKLIVPADWDVQSDVAAIFGGVDDKRPPVANPAANKVLYLDGTCIFGGLEIKSY